MNLVQSYSNLNNLEEIISEIEKKNEDRITMPEIANLEQEN